MRLPPAPCAIFPLLLLASGLAAAQPETPERAAELLARGAPPPMMAGQNHAVPPMPTAAQQPNPLDATLRQVRTTLAASPLRSPTGVTSRDYAAIANGIVQYFRHFQAPGGRIVDPFMRREFQYSTPTYALAAATLATGAGVNDLLDSAARALDSSLFQLASGTPADRHGDFFIVPTMLAYDRLQGRVDAATRARWEKYLRMIDPKVAYTDLIGPGQADVINWNTGAIAGEFMRHKRGFTDAAFAERYLAAQLPRFTPTGTYRDPGAPVAYDAEARFNLTMLLEAGYDGPQRQALETLLERGAWAALLMQSPRGDAPAGGRSAEHAWNDALACATFELWARRSKARGDMAAASAFKRAARQAARAVARWVRPSGELWVVKNRFDPAVRRGFEPYSSHSQYNLLAAAYLAIAASVADESIPEGPSPADAGGFAIELPALHKVFANAGGHYLEIDTAADIDYDSTGLMRVHRPDMDNAIGPNASAPAKLLPLAAGGIAWPDGKGGWEWLAQFGQGKVKASMSVATATPAKVEFSVRYELTGAAIAAVTESYSLAPDAVTVTVRLEGGTADRWRLAFPAFSGDGRERAGIGAANEGLIVRTASSAQGLRIVAPDKAQALRTGRIVALRNGDYEAIEWGGAGRQVTYRLAAPSAAGTPP
ncbi:hypothetical protein [Ramlibacter sp. PS4R-6]|uniref:hypothetical protein n=1 Tax=Ramlibacter sp. PS4R-6 TaxID=3133438 RepID=UPI0030A204E4